MQAEHGRGRTCGESADAAAEATVPPLGDRSAWQRSMHDPEFPPFAHTLARMDNALAANCLCTLAADVAQKCGGGAAQEGEWGAGGGAPGGVEGMPPHLGLWLYGLMVRLELPISANVAAAMRKVVLIAERCRARCAEGTGPEASAAEMPEGKCADDGVHGEGGAEGGQACGGDEAMDVGDGDGAGDRQRGVRGAQDELAVCDTLRVVAGGFFGQDAALAPVVDDYLVRMSLR